VKQGEIWLADLPPPMGRRPVVLVMRDDLYERRSQVIVVPVTTRVRGMLAEVPVGPAEGLDMDGVANFSTIQTVARSRLERQIGSLAPEQMEAMAAALRFIFDLRP
jgi:mRNA interferase MazF